MITPSAPASGIVRSAVIVKERFLTFQKTFSVMPVIPA